MTRKALAQALLAVLVAVEAPTAAIMRLAGLALQGKEVRVVRAAASMECAAQAAVEAAQVL